MKYQQRAEKFYAAAPSNAKLRTLIRLGQWTHRFATHVGMSLGAVIKEVMTEREAIWVVSQHQLAPPGPERVHQRRPRILLPPRSLVRTLLGNSGMELPFAVRFSADNALLLGGPVMLDSIGAGTC